MNAAVIETLNMIIILEMILISNPLVNDFDLKSFAK